MNASNSNGIGDFPRVVWGLWIACLLCLVTACGSGESELPLNPAALETAESEAVVRHLLVEASTALEKDSSLPVAILLGSIVAGESPTGASETFLACFTDTGHPLISASQLTLDRDTKATVIENTNTIVLLIQIMASTSTESGTVVDAAWNYGRDVVAKRFQIVPSPEGSTQLTEIEVLRNNRQPIPPSNAQ